jgi:hypothetical protein
LAIDLRLIEPSTTYPVIEVEVLLNFFPGDQHTAEKYKAFVQTLTKVRFFPFPGDQHTA